MFTNRFFGGAYFAARYWPKIGAAVVASINRLLSLLGVGM